MPLAPLFILSMLAAAPPSEEVSAQVARPLFDLEVTANHFSAPGMYYSVASPDPAPLPALSQGASASLLFLISPVDSTWLSERLTVGVGAWWTQWQLPNSERSMWQLGLPIDTRFKLLTGPVRPWVGVRNTWAWMDGSAMPEGTGRVTWSYALRAGVEVRPNTAWAIGAHAGWNTQNAPALGAATYMQWVELGLSVSHRFGG